MSLHALANHMAEHGRGKDSMLVHMTPGEVAGLQSIAKAHGGSLTLNPETGLPEAGFLDEVIKVAAPMALGAALGPAGFGLSAGMSAAAVGGLATLATGSLSRGLMAGMGAYGGAGLAEGLAGTTGATGASLGVEGAAIGPGSQAAMLAEQNAGFGAEGLSKLQSAAQYAKGAGSTSMAGSLASGAANVATSGKAAAEFAKENWKPIAAASLPVLMGNQTTTQMPDNSNALIRTYTFDPYGQRFTAQTPIKASDWGSRDFPTAATGGLMSLAEGGMAGGGPMMGQNNTLDFAEQSEPVVRMADGGEADPTQLPRSQITAPQLAAQESVVNNQQQGALNAVNQGIAAGLTPDQIANSINTTYGKNFGAQNILDFAAANGLTLPTPKTAAPITTPVTTTTDAGTNINVAPNVPAGVSGGGNTNVNPNGTITTAPNIPGRPEGGFTGVQQVKDVYTQGGGSLGYTPYTPKTYDELLNKFPNTGGSEQAYNYLMGKGANTIKPVTPTGEVMKPYAESVLGVPADQTQFRTRFNPVTKQYETNPYYKPFNFDAKTGQDTRGLSSADIVKYVSDEGVKGSYTVPKWMTNNNVTYEQLAAALGISVEEAKKKYPQEKVTPMASSQGNYAENMSGGLALGGLAALAGGGTSDAGYNLGSYSDGGRLLRGPGDGVSDDIPATIGKGQPARLADGEFVVPARIVSELGNGSTDAGARKLYAMMDRVQNNRKKSVGKGKVAVNSRADKYLPA